MRAGRRRESPPLSSGAGIEQKEGIRAFGPYSDVAQLGIEIEAWAKRTKLSLNNLTIEYSSNRAFYAPFTLDAYEAHTALVIWVRP